MKNDKRLRSAVMILVPATMLAATILTAVIYYLLDFFFHISRNEGLNYWIPAIALGSSMVIGMVLSAILFKTMLRPFAEMMEGMGAVSQGDFSVRVDDRKHQGAYGDLIRSFNKMAEELGNLELFRTDFINTFSHEFKTPIVSIRGYAKLLKRPDLTEEERNTALDTILRESERMTQMSTNILLLSRYENTHFLPERKPFALDEQIRQCIGLLEESWLKKDIVLSGDLDAIEYNGNEDMLDHVWLNLLSNAIKFSPQGGEISVSLHRCENRVVARIRDHGPGMPPETVRHIFDKFYKGDSSRNSEGNGLGLPIVKRILTLCGGEITVNTAPGEGSEFVVELPQGEPFL